MKKYIFTLAIILSLLLLSGCARVPDASEAPESRQFFALDTLATITIYTARPGTDISAVFDTCEALCESCEARFSRTRPGSDIYRINHAKGQETAVSSDTFELIREGIQYAELTGGLFDISIAPVIELWGFGTDTETLPDRSALAEALSHVSYKNILLNAEAETVTLKDPAAMLDLGALAKGYIADRLKEQLLSDGVTGAIIDLGGNILTLGHKPDGSPYHIAIKAPFTDTGAYYTNNILSSDSIATAVTVADRSVVTSGIYERYKLIDGNMYHHVLNPETGYPVANSLASVSIISDTSLEGDCLSTSCLLLGKDAAIALIQSRPAVQAILIEKDGTITNVNEPK